MFYLDLLKTLDEHRVRYLLIGGLALNIHGVERATMDVDLMLALDEENIAAFILAAKSLALQPQAPVPLEALADTAQRKQWIQEKHLIAFALRPTDPLAPTLDILLRPPIDFEDAWNRRLEKMIGTIPLQLAHVDDLIALKSGTGRLQDQSDIEALNRLKQLGQA